MISDTDPRASWPPLFSGSWPDKARSALPAEVMYSTRHDCQLNKYNMKAMNERAILTLRGLYVLAVVPPTGMFACQNKILITGKVGQGELHHEPADKEN